MDIGLVQGLWTIVALVIFVGIIAWAYSARRRDSFARAAALPLEDDTQPPATREEREA